jgi:hypothetical protein
MNICQNAEWFAESHFSFPFEIIVIYWRNAVPPSNFVQTSFDFFHNSTAQETCRDSHFVRLDSHSSTSYTGKVLIYGHFERFISNCQVYTD